MKQQQQLPLALAILVGISAAVGAELKIKTDFEMIDLNAKFLVFKSSGGNLSKTSQVQGFKHSISLRPDV